MQLHCGDSLNHVTYKRDSIWCVFPANEVITRDNTLVMGAGMAKQVRDRWPGVDADLAAQIFRYQCAAHGSRHEPYYLLKSGGFPVMAFQTKRNWREPSSTALISRASNMLDRLARTTPHQHYHLGFPGIGKGGLKPLTVWPIIKGLPENVHVWTLHPLTETEISSSYVACPTVASRP